VCVCVGVCVCVCVCVRARACVCVCVSSAQMRVSALASGCLLGLAHCNLASRRAGALAFMRAHLEDMRKRRMAGASSAVLHTVA